MVKSCHCLDYQSCETKEYRDTVACRILEAIEGDAIREWIKDAPWGLSDENLPAVPRARRRG